jgi:hypothetical protein
VSLGSSSGPGLELAVHRHLTLDFTQNYFFLPKKNIFKNYGSGSRTWSGFGSSELEPDLVV